MARTFSQSAVLASESHLTEVGVVGTVIAAPSEPPVGEAGVALERGVALLSPGNSSVRFTGAKHS